MSDFEIVLLKTGRKSLRCLKSGETFHPVVGPTHEAQTLHVEQQRLVERSAEPGTFVIWDVGLGAAANAVTAIRALESARDVVIHSFDRDTTSLEFALGHLDDLDYLKGFEAPIAELVQRGFTQVSPGIRWHFHRGDFADELKNGSVESPHAVLFDPYSPTGNPDMWTLEIFERLRARMPKDRLGLFTNYSRSTAVRVNLLLAGFAVGSGFAVGEKAETTIAANRLADLAMPLGRDWLVRVKRSRNAAPLRSVPYTIGPISAEDYEKLAALPQFQGV